MNNHLKKIIQKLNNNTRTTNEATITFVDVDYTITPNRYPKERLQTYTSIWHGSHQVSQTLLEDLQKIDGKKIWLTAWCGEAEEVFKMGWEYSEWRDSDYYDWKVETVNEFLEENSQVTKLIWLDDDLDKFEHKLITRRGLETLLIRPKNYRGLSETEVLKAIEFSKN